MSFHVLNPTLLKGRVATPVANLTSGTIYSPAILTITTRTPGALIFYTTDGSFPSVIYQDGNWIALGTAVEFTQSLRLERTLTRSDYVFRAVAVKQGFQDSAMASFSYHLAVMREMNAVCDLTTAGAVALSNQSLDADVEIETAGDMDLQVGELNADIDAVSVFLPDAAALMSMRINGTVSMTADGAANLHDGGNFTCTCAVVFGSSGSAAQAARLLYGLTAMYRFNDTTDTKGAPKRFYNALDGTGADGKYLNTLGVGATAVMQACTAFWPMHETSGTAVADLRASGTGQVVTYHGATTDSVGQWGSFAANGSPDMEFRFVNDVNSAIVKIQVTTDESSGWLWSTYDNRYYPAGVKLSGGLVATQYSSNLNLSCYNETVKVLLCTVSTGGQYAGKTYRMLVYYANGSTKVFIGTSDLRTTPGNLTASVDLSGATTTGPVTTGLNTTSCLLSITSDIKFSAQPAMIIGGWVKFGDTAVTQCIVQKAGAYSLFWKPDSGGKLVFRSIVGGTPMDREISLAPGTSQWHFVAGGFASIEGSQFTNAFVGVATNSGTGFACDFGNLTNGLPGATGGTFSIGGGTADGLSSNPFKGVLAEFGVWSNTSTYSLRPWELWVKTIAGCGPLTFPMAMSPKVSAALVDYAIEAAPIVSNVLDNPNDVALRIPSTLVGGPFFPVIGGANANMTVAFWIRIDRAGGSLLLSYGNFLTNPLVGASIRYADWGMTFDIRETSTGVDRYWGGFSWYHTNIGISSKFEISFPLGTGSPTVLTLSHTIPNEHLAGTWNLCCVSISGGKVWMSLNGENWVEKQVLPTFVAPGNSPRTMSPTRAGGIYPQAIGAIKLAQPAFWTRKLNRTELAELFNNRNGIAFADWTN